ncbi:MAG: ketol-acid reductoisomerase [Candidatus Eisenbacteria bacterium]|nr:ketol-acid reductoisomerase [Candidatus Eisenbacteria bacterium]
MIPRYGVSEAPLEPLRGLRVTVFGYGNQGRAQSLNLRDSGVDVRVALRDGSASADAARGEGLTVTGLEEGARAAHLAALLVPDEAMPELVRGLAGAWAPGCVFVLAHAYNLVFAGLDLPPGAKTACVAPAGPGSLVRSRFTEGLGVTAFLALSDPADAGLRALGLAYAAAIGCARAGVLECTARQEAEVDLFGEQAVLCGGLTSLVGTAFDTLLDAGYPPEMAYLECVHQVNLTAQLIHDGGVEGMRDRISPTALFGDLTRSPRIAAALRPVFAALLDEIRDGRFSRHRDAVAADGPARMKTLRAAARHRDMAATREKLGL